MVKFEKDLTNMLPYDREQYLDFFDDEVDALNPTLRWYGISLQLDKIRNQKLYNVTNDIVEQSIDLLEASFKTIVSKLDQGLFWVINHDDKDMDWFLNGDNKLPALRDLFKRYNVPNSYRGGLTFLKEDLFTFARDLVSYPYAFSYKNLDISHSKLQFIIKITGHLTIDLLGTDKVLLDKIASDRSLDSFIKVNYRTR
jgi:hypothetical protein